MSHTHTSPLPARQPPHKPPGPPDRWWGLPLLREMRDDYLAFEARMRREHGEICVLRLGYERAWNLMSPELVREALVGQHAQLIRWERGIEVFSQVLGQSVLVSEGETWQRQRRMLMPAFTPRRVAGYATLMAQAAQRVLDRALLLNQSQGTVAMDDLWSEATMDVILQVLFSHPAEGDARRAAEANRTLGETGYREMFMPMTLPDWLPLPGKRAKRQALCTLRGLIQRHIDARPTGDTAQGEAQDLLGMLLSLRDEDSGAALTPEEVFDQCMVTFQAGHDTTTSGLLWWSWLMASHPEAAQRATDEVDAVLGGAMPTAEDAARLPWLQATLKEALRLYPPAPALMSRRTTAPIALGGWSIPKGSMLRLTPWVLHRDEQLFPQAERFLPERFMAGAPPIPKGAWMPFGAGPRVCIGQHFAQLEMALLAAMLLQRYRLAVPPGAEPPTPLLHVTLKSAQPIRLVLQRRAPTAAPAASGLRSPSPSPATRAP
ncbi:cytochrome P450 [Hydrogenophaga flava]|uniref:cytochrome P450 n=1 Tax=Hydrogenophaga flava TaxID=65657 RepID=UPI000A032733|nr:cytochrome P450 [Hydrogenophaga flava]